MADWRKLALAAFLADGKVDETEIKILKKELYADKKIDEDEIAFLVDLRSTYQKKAKLKKEAVTDTFENFFFKVVQDYVLLDDQIDAGKAAWLQSTLFKSGKPGERDKKFLAGLKKKVKKPSPEFDKLAEEVAVK
jgi:hypothetical protein